MAHMAVSSNWTRTQRPSALNSGSNPLAATSALLPRVSLATPFTNGGGIPHSATSSKWNRTIRPSAYNRECFGTWSNPLVATKYGLGLWKTTQFWPCALRAPLTQEGLMNVVRWILAAFFLLLAIYLMPIW